MKCTQQLRLLARVLLAAPDDHPRWGYELGKAAGLRSGVLYPILDRMLAAGWLADAWETDPHPGRPARRYYRLTFSGRQELEAMTQGDGGRR